MNEKVKKGKKERERERFLGEWRVDTGGGKGWENINKEEKRKE